MGCCCVVWARAILSSQGKFYGNGFKFDDKVLPAAKLRSLIADAGARETCVKKTDHGLSGRPIQSCTQVLCALLSVQMVL
jgi:hypothetical protein